VLGDPDEARGHEDADRTEAQDKQDNYKG
jgi:hypothetical protein